MISQLDISEKDVRTKQGIKLIAGLDNFIERNIVNSSTSDFLYLNHYEPSQTECAGIDKKGIIVNKCLNTFRRINKYLEAVNSDLEEGEYFATCLITENQHKNKFFNNRTFLIASMLYFKHFLIHRVLPKIQLTQEAYFKFTNGRYRALSLTEALGRLCCCGFEIVDYQQLGDKTFIISRKENEPAYDMNPTYGPIVKLKRHCNKGKMIEVYKFRTMYPYAEYLQEFVYNKNGLTEGGDNFQNDFRITSWGKILRKYWLDELPMFVNLLSGDLKLIGVRPLSKQYYNLYPKRLKLLRKKTKPGLLPPFYADLPETLDDKIDSEINYLESYLRNPIKTDLKYGYKILKNIIFNNARSK